MWQNRLDLPFFDTLVGWVKSAKRLANKPYRQSAGFVRNANLFSETKKRQFLDFQAENLTKLTLSGTLDAIRTRGLPLRRRTLYPAELRGLIDSGYSRT